MRIKVAFILTQCPSTGLKISAFMPITSWRVLGEEGSTTETVPNLVGSIETFNYCLTIMPQDYTRVYVIINTTMINNTSNNNDNQQHMHNYNYL